MPSGQIVAAARVGGLKKSSTEISSGSAMTVLSRGWFRQGSSHRQMSWSPPRGRDCSSISLWWWLFQLFQGSTGPPKRPLVASRMARSINARAPVE